MPYIIVICFLLTFGYVLLMLVYRHGWMKQNTFRAAKSDPQTFISIIIPARNEARSIGNCISSILAQDYPKDLFEIIVVDDHSEDDTAGIVASFNASNVHCIKLAEYVSVDEKINAFKKKALSVGISQSKGTLIITTDADCTASQGWLNNMAVLYEKEQSVMIVAPVSFTNDDSVVQLFQSIDFMSMQGITAAALQMKMGNMSNGANLAFERGAYDAVHGYEGITQLASGDDYLLMMKLQKQFPGRIGYLKNEKAIVQTTPQADWSSFLQQRIRWASKSGKYNDGKLTGILIFVYLFNLSFLLLAIGAICTPFLLGVAGLMLLWKIIAELYFLYPVAGFFGKRKELRYFPFLQPLHIFYIILAGFLGFAGGYKWKGRSVR